MGAPLCAFVSPPPSLMRCPAYAAPDSEYCPVHRDRSLYKRVPPQRGTPKPLLCARCHEEIKVGTVQRMTDHGPVHAEFICVPE